MEVISISFDQMDGHIWFNGEFVPWADARIHVLSHGLHYASCVFEGERAMRGKFSNSVSIRRGFYSAGARI